MKNKLYNFFALVGFVTTFIIACSSYIEMDDMDEQSSGTTNVDVTLQNEYGKYDIEVFNSREAGWYLVATNTETGVTKVYYNNRQDGFVENTRDAITLTH